MFPGSMRGGGWRGRPRPERAEESPPLSPAAAALRGPGWSRWPVRESRSPAREPPRRGERARQVGPWGGAGGRDGCGRSALATTPARRPGRPGRARNRSAKPASGRLEALGSGAAAAAEPPGPGLGPAAPWAPAGGRFRGSAEAQASLGLDVSGSGAGGSSRTFQWPASATVTVSGTPRPAARALTMASGMARGVGMEEPDVSEELPGFAGWKTRQNGSAAARRQREAVLEDGQQPEEVLGARDAVLRLLGQRLEDDLPQLLRHPAAGVRLLELAGRQEEVPPHQRGRVAAGDRAAVGLSSS